MHPCTPLATRLVACNVSIDFIRRESMSFNSFYKLDNFFAFKCCSIKCFRGSMYKFFLGVFGITCNAPCQMLRRKTFRTPLILHGISKNIFLYAFKCVLAELRWRMIFSNIRYSSPTICWNHLLYSDTLRNFHATHAKIR